MDAVRLGKARYRLVWTARLQVDTAEVVQREPLRIPTDISCEVERFAETLGGLVKPTEFQTELTVVVQAYPEESGIADIAQYLQGSRRMLQGGLRSLQLVIRVRERDRGLRLAGLVADLTADLQRLLKHREGLFVTHPGKRLAQVLQHPRLSLTVPGTAGAVRPDPVRDDAIRPVVTPVEGGEQRR